MKFNFNNIGYSRIILEADNEPEPNDNEAEDYMPDNGALDNEEPAADDTNSPDDETTDDNTASDYMPGNMDDDTETTDDTETDGAEDGADAETGDETTDDAGDGMEDETGMDTADDTTDGESRETLFDDLNEIENQLFSDLTDEQKAFKHKELKSNFVKLYDSTEKALQRLNRVPKTKFNVAVLKLAARKLVELKDMIHINITETYYTRTFFENDILYKQCLAQFDAVTKLLIELVPDEETDGEPAEEPIENQIEDEVNSAEI